VNRVEKEEERKKEKKICVVNVVEISLPPSL
jgi:hypothetical protein